MPTLGDLAALFIDDLQRMLRAIRLVALLQPFVYVCVAWFTRQASAEAVRDANGDGALLAGELYHLFDGPNP